MGSGASNGVSVAVKAPPKSETMDTITAIPKAERDKLAKASYDPKWTAFVYHQEVGGAAGIPFYSSNSLGQKVLCEEEAPLPWGEIVEGTSVDDEWVRVRDHYLPKQVNSMPVLLPGNKPPHMPATSIVTVGRERRDQWQKLRGHEFESSLACGAIAMLDSSYLVTLAAKGETLAPRQATPDEAFLSVTNMQASLGELMGNGDAFGGVLAALVSHAWLQADHPDPHGHNLRVLAGALKVMLQSRFPGPGGMELIGRKLGVFLDFSSIHQCCRNDIGEPQSRTFRWLDGQSCFEHGAIGRLESEDVLFKEGLESLGALYSHDATIVLMLTAFPQDYADPSRYRRSGNVAPYFERGWCFCESSLAFLTKASALTLDLGREGVAEASDIETLRRAARVGRPPPVLPKELEVSLEKKGFTNGRDDRPRVASIYSTAFEKHLAAAQTVVWDRLGWGDESAAAAARALTFAAMPELQWLNLRGNAITDRGAATVAGVLSSGLAPRLRALQLEGNVITDEGAAALAAAVRSGGAPALTAIRLQGNRVSYEAQEEVRRALVDNKRRCDGW